MGVLGLTRTFHGVHFIRTTVSFHLQRKSFSNAAADDSILPVLIVGAGPVGLVLSVLLTKLGVKCAVLEKSATFSKHPQAHFINNRSMEVFRKLDGLAKEIQNSQPPVEFWRKFIYCTSLTGSVLGSVDHMQPQDFDRIVSPESVAHFSQYKLVNLLLTQLKNLDFHINSHKGLRSFNDGQTMGEILMGHECVSIHPNENYVNVTASCIEDGKSIEKDLKCSIVVGTDGAGSTVRKLMGIEMRGEKDLQKLISVHFMSPELGQYLIKERPGMLFFIFNTEAIGVLVAHDLNLGEFVLQLPFYPPQQMLEDYNFEMCGKLISKLVGREFSDIDVKDIKPWVMHAEVSEKYLSGDNRIILAGDAAHRFPPAGGFGMNTGIQDAHNIAWKLASVFQGICPMSLLSTYETERRPIAFFNTALSVQNFRAAMDVPAALGLDPAIANSVHQVVNNVVGSILPSTLQKTILDGIFSIGRAQLSDSVLNKNNPLGASRLAHLKSIFEGGKSLQLQFPAEDLGFRYLKGALIPDGDSKPLDAAPEEPTGRRRDYIPSAVPGSRLPHMTVRLLSKPPTQETFSTLDLVAGDKAEFLLIIAPVEPSYRLAQATFKVADEFNLPIKVCMVWPNGTVDGGSRSRTVLEPWENYVDVVEVRQPSLSSSSWWDICDMTHRGAILVRPDEHIAWRAKTGVVGDIYFELRRIFSAILGF